MQLLVFAQTPPPRHGQSTMVATLLDALRADPAFEVHHINARLSADSSEVGRWRPRKLARILALCATAWRVRRRHGPMTFYYVPAPARRVAIYRDLLVMLLCRRFFSRLALHWHAVGLGGWLATGARAPERWLVERLLGRADLAIVLAPELAADAAAFAPKRMAVVPNCVADPGPPPDRPMEARHHVVFLGLCSREKGLFDTLDAIEAANQRDGNAYRLSVAGAFADRSERDEFDRRQAQLGSGAVDYLGELEPEGRDALLATAGVLCFPTSYPHEGQPLVIMEALAHDLPIVTTRWRAIPGMLPASHAWTVTPHRPDEIAEALMAARRAGSPHGACRRHWLAHFTTAHHANALKAALATLAQATT